MFGKIRTIPFKGCVYIALVSYALCVNALFIDSAMWTTATLLFGGMLWTLNAALSLTSAAPPSV